MLKSISSLRLYLLISVTVISGRVAIEDPLTTFLRNLERYENTVNDIVFLLHAPGYVSYDAFASVKRFFELIMQRFSVTPQHSRVAVVTFSIYEERRMNYISYPYGNKCTMLEDIDGIDLHDDGIWTWTDNAMSTAKSILEKARPDSKKIIILLLFSKTSVGHSPVPISESLKRKGVIIFAIGYGDVDADEIYEVATTPDHVYFIKDLDYLSHVNRYLITDNMDLSFDMTNASYHCRDVCDGHAKCYCGTRTGKYDCICDTGYFGRGYAGFCLKCPAGTYRSDITRNNCSKCPEHSTTFAEASDSLTECICEPGYKKNGNICEYTSRCSSEGKLLPGKNDCTGVLEDDDEISKFPSGSFHLSEKLSSLVAALIIQLLIKLP